MLKDGYKVQRKGWGDMYVTLTKDKKNFIIRNGWRVFEFADLLAEDWQEYRES